MKKQESTGEGKKLAVILVRGQIEVRKPIKETLRLLNLNRKNHCIVVDKNKTGEGMIRRVKDYVTWGEIDEKTYQELVQKRGKEYLGKEADSKNKIRYTSRFFEYNHKKYLKYFPLNPPKKGFGRKGIKTPFKLGGALGYRGDKINDLIRRMI